MLHITVELPSLYFTVYFGGTTHAGYYTLVLYYHKSNGNSYMHNTIITVQNRTIVTT